MISRPKISPTEFASSNVFSYVELTSFDSCLSITYNTLVQIDVSDLHAIQVIVLIHFYDSFHAIQDIV